MRIERTNYLSAVLSRGSKPSVCRSSIPPRQPRTGWATFQVTDVEGLVLQCEPGVDPGVSAHPDTKLIWNLGL